MKKGMALVLILGVLGCFLLGVTCLERGQQQEDCRRLEEALRRGAVACYGAEGFYPPDLEYLCGHYGVQYEKDRYVVHYDAFASNLMPDITVLEK